MKINGQNSFYTFSIDSKSFKLNTFFKSLMVIKKNELSLIHLRYPCQVTLIPLFWFTVLGTALGAGPK